MSTAAGSAGLREVFSVPEFRALWAGQLLSVAGDQLAKVAVTVLVYDRTNSAILAALAFAASFLPTFLGGVALTGLADRLPRRAVMIGCDLMRMGLAAAMAVPGAPVAVLVVLLFVITLISPPFTAARAAIYPEILTGDLYVTGTAITLTTFQLAQVVGFAVGGAMTALLGPRVCLLVDAATFAASALLIRIAVAARPAANADTEEKISAIAGIVAGARLVFSDPALKAPMLLAWLAAFYNAPEGVAAPFARELGGGALTTGLLLASPAAGYAVVALTFNRLLPQERRDQLMRPMAVTCCALLILVAAQPGLPATLVILAVSGACAGCYQPLANSAFVRAAPPQQRSQAFGLATAGMALGQGAAFIAAGAAAQQFAPATVVAAAGTIGVAAALGLTLPLLSRRPTRLRPGADD